jgi:hypothetical protein
VKIVLENMCGQGSTVGGDLAEIRQILDLVTDQTRVGVCLDTCHAMAAGYDLSQQVNSLEQSWVCTYVPVGFPTDVVLLSDGGRVAEPENLTTVPVPTFYLITVPVLAPVPVPVPGHIHTVHIHICTYLYL